MFLFSLFHLVLKSAQNSNQSMKRWPVVTSCSPVLGFSPKNRTKSWKLEGERMKSTINPHCRCSLWLLECYRSLLANYTNTIIFENRYFPFFKFSHTTFFNLISLCRIWKTHLLNVSYIIILQAWITHLKQIRRLPGREVVIDIHESQTFPKCHVKYLQNLLVNSCCLVWNWRKSPNS